jgi:hypothetical protein
LSIFINELDKCRESYTVEFLEGIQTLFKEADVAYIVVVAVDTVSASYEKAYATFKCL